MPRILLGHTITGELSEGVSGSYNHRKAVAGALNELRRAIGITQERLAKALRINQAGVSKIESRSDIFLSTLRKAIEAMGGKLEIHAKFPAGEVRIRQFGGLARKRRSRSRRGDASRRPRAAT